MLAVTALNYDRLYKERRLQHPGGILNYSSSYLWGLLVTNIRTHVNLRIYESDQLFYIPNCGCWVSQLARGLEAIIMRPLYRRKKQIGSPLFDNLRSASVPTNSQQSYLQCSI